MTNEFADVISVSNSDSSSETYTISEDEEVEEEDADEETDEKKIMEAESVRKRFKLMILETTDANESNTVNLTEGDKIRGLEMVTNTTALNLEKVSVNETVTQSNQESEDGTSRKQTDSETMILTQTVDANFAANTQQDSMAITGAIVLSESLTSDVSSNAPVSEISPESAPEQTLSKSSIKISSERSNEITPESSFGAIISKATPFPQAFFHQNVPTANDVKKNPKAPDAVALISPQVTTSRTNPKTAAFQKDVPGTSRSLLEQSTFSISGSGQNGQKLAAVSIASPVSIQPTIISGSGTEAQATVPRLLPETAVSQQVQVQRSFSAPTSESSENQVSSQIQQAPQLSEPNVASTCPESLSNLVSSTGKECLAHEVSEAAIRRHLTNEAVPGITAAIIPEIPGAAESDVMEKGNDRNEIIPKEQQSKEVGVKLMTESKVEDLENMEVPSDAIMGLSVTEFVSQDMQNSPTTRMVPCKADEAKSTTAEFETPRKPAAGIDTRTITRPPKARVQQLPEATVMPLMKNGTGTAAAEVITANTEIKSSAVFSGQPLPSPFATSTPSHTPVQLPQVLGQQSSVPSRPQIPQQTVLPTSVQQNAQITTTKPVPQQTSMPKISSQLQQQQQQPSATGAPIRNVTQPIVVPPSITPFVQGVSTNSSAIVSNTAPQGSSQDVSQREERKLLRARQRTITVQSQVSLDITAAYNEVKQLNSDDPATELVRRVQAIVATREKEWTAKTEKLTQLLAHEQRRNEPLEQKAAERLLAMAEYEKLVQEFVEELKKKNSDEKNNLGESKSVGRPGPERNLSPDDVTQLIKERDQLAEEVNSLETSYSELFRRYEKLRQTSVEIKRNEESVKNASEEMARRYAILAEKFEMLRRNAEEQLDLANNEIERLIKQHEADTLGLRLKVKHQESKIDSLTVSLEARQKELESMTAIFEEVITKAEANDAEVDAS